MKSLSEIRRLSREHDISRMLGGIHRRAILIGLVLAASRFFFLLSMVFFLLWSYSIWGSESTPLRYLLEPGIFLLALSAIIRVIIGGVMQWTRRATTLHARRLRARIERRSQIVSKDIGTGDDDQPPA